MDRNPATFTNTLRKQLVLALALNWKAPAKATMFPPQLVDTCLSFDSDLAEVGDQLWRAGKEMTYEPKALGFRKICWNCGHTTQFQESSPQLLSYCRHCRRGTDEHLSLWFTINCLQTTFRGHLHYLQIQAMLYDAVYSAKGLLP